MFQDVVKLIPNQSPRLPCECVRRKANLQHCSAPAQDCQSLVLQFPKNRHVPIVQNQMLICAEALKSSNTILNKPNKNDQK